MRLLAPFVVLLALGSGCATNLSTLQTATPVRRGQVQVAGGMGLYGNLGAVATVVDQGITQVSAAKRAAETGEPYALSEADQQELLTAGIALLVLPPFAQGYELSVRTGLMREDLDVGFRYSGNALRLDSKYRFFHGADDAGSQLPPSRRRSFDLAVGVAVSKYLFENPVFSALDYVQLNDFSRWDLEVPLYASLDVGEIFKFYVAPKYVYSHTKLDQSLVNYTRQATNLSGFDLRLPSSVDMHFGGLTGGVAVGYKYIHLYLELTSGYTYCEPVVFGERRSLGGVTLYPAVGVALKSP